MEKLLTTRPAPWDAAALDALAVKPRHDTTGGLQSVADVCQGAHLFELLDRDLVVMRYALSVRQHSFGREGWIHAAAGNLPGFDLTAVALAAIELQLLASGCDALALYTARAGLVKKLERSGFQIAGYLMRKRLHSCH